MATENKLKNLETEVEEVTYEKGCCGKTLADMRKNSLRPGRWRYCPECHKEYIINSDKEVIDPNTVLNLDLEDGIYNTEAETTPDSTVLAFVILSFDSRHQMSEKITDEATSDAYLHIIDGEVKGITHWQNKKLEFAHHISGEEQELLEQVRRERQLEEVISLIPEAEGDVNAGNLTDLEKIKEGLQKYYDWRNTGSDLEAEPNIFRGKMSELTQNQSTSTRDIQSLPFPHDPERMPRFFDQLDGGYYNLRVRNFTISRKCRHCGTKFEGYHLMWQGTKKMNPTYTVNGSIDEKFTNYGGRCLECRVKRRKTKGSSNIEFEEPEEDLIEGQIRDIFEIEQDGATYQLSMKSPTVKSS